MIKINVIWHQPIQVYTQEDQTIKEKYKNASELKGTYIKDFKIRCVSEIAQKPEPLDIL